MILNTPDSIADKKIFYIKKCIRDTINNRYFLRLIKTIFKGSSKENIVTLLWAYLSNIKFVVENNGNDYCKDGLELLQSGFGDCEDFTVLIASIFTLYGIKFKIKVTDTFGNGYYTHVLIQFYDKNRWVSMDGTYRIKGLGGEPKHYRTRLYAL